MKHIIFTIACIILGPFLIWNGFSDIVTALRAKSWPTVQGLVESTSIDTRRNSKGRMTYTPIIQYAYDVDGTRYLGDRLSYSDRSSSSEEDAVEITGKYPNGRSVVIHYDSKNPRVSALEVGTTLNNWIVLILGFAATGLGLFFGRSYWQSLKHSLTSTDFRPSSGF